MGDILSENLIYRNVYQVVLTLVGPDLSWLAYVVAAMSVIMLVVNGALGIATVYLWVERRLLGRFQGRLGPNRVGPFGLFQPIADAIKILTKEDIVPRGADRWVFNLAPIVMLASTVMILGVVPFGAQSFIANLNVGLLYVVAMGGMASVAVLMAGYSSANKYSMFGSMRAVAMLVSYEIPLVMSLLGIVVLSESMSLVGIVDAQTIPFFVIAPLGMFIFLASISAELNRSPFDITEAESELVAGYQTEYSGMKFGTFMLAEFTNVIIAGGIFAVLFLQGWKWAILPSHLWFLIKVGAFAVVATWVRATLPRLRIDQILGFGWKFLFPASLINLTVITVEVLLWPERTATQLWTMAGINWALACVTIVGLSRLVSLRAKKAPSYIRGKNPLLGSTE
jgi:NADH-quinone oxidoreductase subunit H